MEKSISETLRGLAWPVYFVAFLLVAISKMDYLSNVWPLRLGDVQWRYGSIGLLAGFLLTPLLGFLMAMVAAAILDHRIVLRVISIVGLLTGAFLLLAVPLFSLDALQLRGTVPSDASSLYDVGSLKAFIKQLTIGVAFGWLGWAGIRATKDSGRKKRQTSPPLARSRQERSG